MRDRIYPPHAVRNPVNRVKYEPEPEQKDRYVTREEANKLLEAAPPYFKPILETAFHTGMRLQEILGLKWEQVTLYNPPKIRLAEGKKVPVFGVIQLEGQQTKNKKNRLIPVNQTLSKVLLEIKDQNEYVFIGTKGTRLKSVTKPSLQR